MGTKYIVIFSQTNAKTNFHYVFRFLAISLKNKHFLLTKTLIIHQDVGINTINALKHLNLSLPIKSMLKIISHQHIFVAFTRKNKSLSVMRLRYFQIRIFLSCYREAMKS